VRIKNSEEIQEKSHSEECSIWVDFKSKKKLIINLIVRIKNPWAILEKSHSGQRFRWMDFWIDEKAKNILLCVPSISTRIRVLFMSFLTDTIAFYLVSGRKLASSCFIPVTGNIRKRTVLGTVFFRSEHCFYVPCIFSTGFCSILRDPVAGIIDLGSFHERKRYNCSTLLCLFNNAVEENYQYRLQACI
jgi:hypothetical protein